MNYQDFDLLIDRSGDSLRAQVINSPAGQATADFTLPFSEDKLENFLLRLGRTNRRGTRRVETQEMTAAKVFGAALFTAVFSGDVKACFRSSFDEARRQNAGLRIRLRLSDPSVVDLPWEYLYNPAVNRFLALSIHTPLVRFMDLPERIQPLAVTPPIRVLVMISSPTDYPTLDVEAEWRRLNEALADVIAKGQIAIERLDDATLETLQRRLRRERYHIFHFIGHGEFDESAQEGVLILEGEKQRGHRVSSQSLGMMLHDHESLRLAILNACEGARTSRTDPFAGSAQSLVQQGIPAVIAMQFEIADDVASRFAHEFYGALADGYPVDASLTEARKSIFAARHEVEWGTPVLYLRAPDGRIFDLETNIPPRPLSSVESGTQGVESSTRLTQERLTQDLVAAARAAFAGGRRAEAIEMLRRYDPSKEAVAAALRELTGEHQRIAEDEKRSQKAAMQEHLTAASDLLAAGNLAAAWQSACDALQLDPANPQAVALEQRIRKDLDEQVAREQTREMEKAVRAQAEQARESALTQARADVEKYLDDEDLENADKELKAAESAWQPGAAFADLHNRLAEQRRLARAREDKRADDAITEARNEFSRSPSRAIGLLEQFSPTHPRVSAVCRELKDLVAEQNERAAREAERRAAEARDRQRAEEQRQRDLLQAVQRIDAYIERQELPEAEAALEASRNAFGTNVGLAALRERLLAAKRRADIDQAAQTAIARARQLAAAGDYAAAVASLETFQPRHGQVDEAIEALRHQSEASQRRRDVDRRISEAIARAAGEPSHRTALAGLQEVLALDPDNAELLGAIRRRRAAMRRARVRAGAATLVRSRLVTVAVPLLLVVFLGYKLIPPLLSRWSTPERPPVTAEQQKPATPTQVVEPPPTRDVPPVAATKPAEPPAAPDNSALVKAAAEARRRALRERQRAVDAKANGLARFKEGEEAMALGAERASQDRHQESADAYSDAAKHFRRSVDDAETKPASPPPIARGERPGTAVVTPPGNAGRGTTAPSSPAPSAGDKPAEASRGNTAPVAAEPIPKAPVTTLPPPVRPLPVRTTIEAALEAYQQALTRKDEVALRAVYPRVPKEVIEVWTKKDTGVRYSSVQIIQTRSELDGPTRVQIECTFFYNFITGPGRDRAIPQKRLVVLERRGESWEIADDRKR